MQLWAPCLILAGRKALSLRLSVLNSKDVVPLLDARFDTCAPCRLQASGLELGMTSIQQNNYLAFCHGQAQLQHPLSRRCRISAA